VFKFVIFRDEFEKILNAEWPGFSPISNLQIKQSQSGDSFTLIFDTPALLATEPGEIQDVADALFRLSKKGGPR